MDENELIAAYEKVKKEYHDWFFVSNSKQGTAKEITQLRRLVRAANRRILLMQQQMNAGDLTNDFGRYIQY